MDHDKHLAVDLDGTLLQYQDFNPSTFGEPVEGMVELLHQVRAAGWKIIIWTVRRETQSMIDHLEKHNVPYDYINWQPWPEDSSNKVSADVYLDDRAIQFSGNTEGLLEKILNFKPWNKDK
jgi:hypothetical protein